MAAKKKAPVKKTVKAATVKVRKPTDAAIVRLLKAQKQFEAVQEKHQGVINAFKLKYNLSDGYIRGLLKKPTKG